MHKKGLKDIVVRDKRVFVRVDFNVPMDDHGNITNDTRIRAALPTIQYLIGEGAKIILASHLGRPKGKPDPKYSLAPVAKRLSKLLNRPVSIAPDCIGPEVEKEVAQLHEGEVLLLENVRYHEEEEKNEPEFVKQLARLAEVYVNDAFGTAHRAHASTEGIAHHIPGVAGLLLQKEIESMGKALEDAERPFVAIIGGAKVSDKIGVIENLLNKVDALIIGGGMANTFLKAQGYDLGKSLVEADKLSLAQEILDKAQELKVDILLPQDVVAAKEFKADAPYRITTIQELTEDEMALDIGPESAGLFSERIQKARTIVWNGPMGVFEMEHFAKGTEKVAQAVALCPGMTIVGGGDSVAAVEKMGVGNQMSHISTGGGASLKLLEGKTLPGVAALQTI
ncbi:3-phosphoglycerate kinase [Desulfitobacterium dehalogenans ATCC 51507]|uniref:Phosphoglycerate kinase n=1 Tax=Desulfitobacterium dehalogenans (strain ATCC 51507 / DSM 9161 / JW/IU-DC1) TaxID=756499 RepID=I4AEB0_DESDJ|nr:phosphoglycerate kinase [Desulfitobacterium dehalogenans]AFM02295.1 3-phosphoglycerate kinase [Desulfitobacterium dehalogenans ATCC 51507]